MVRNEYYDVLRKVVKRQHNGEAVGITSVCSANKYVLHATVRAAVRENSFIAIESTCNQVNQFGGYTGMVPAQFSEYVRKLADSAGLGDERVILGGDHLGPYPWRKESADRAMEKAHEMVRHYVQAGYTKIHCDASMRLGDDPAGPLSTRVAANRAADLAATAEETIEKSGGDSSSLAYVIGTEVPAPGGAQGSEEDDHIPVTQVSNVEETIALTRAAFFERGLEAAWQRVIAVVVQPGVEFTDASVYDYQPSRASELSYFIETLDDKIYEAHSTDYQTRQALEDLVSDHFAILKVGPALTFAFREAVFALSLIEEELFQGRQLHKLSRIRRTLDDAMLADDTYWNEYYTGSPAQQSFARQYSLSDRSRYYWSVNEVSQALNKLIGNLSGTHMPIALISQYLPMQYTCIRNGVLENTPTAIIENKIQQVLFDYLAACHPE